MAQVKCGCYDLMIGEEVRLSNRFLGKQVYAILIDFGNLPASGEKNVAHNLTDVDQIGVDYSRSWVEQSNGNRYGLDFPNTTENSFWRVKVNPTEVGIQVGRDRSTFTAKVCLWYTKASELPGDCEGIDCHDVLLVAEDARDRADAARLAADNAQRRADAAYSLAQTAHAEAGAAQATADEALILGRNAVPRAGDTTNSHVEVSAPRSVSSITLNRNSDNVITIQASGTLSVSAEPLADDLSKRILLNVNATGDTGITWPEAVKWQNEAVTHMRKGGKLTVLLIFTNGVILGRTLDFVDGKIGTDGTNHILISGIPQGGYALAIDPEQLQLEQSNIVEALILMAQRQGDNMFLLWSPYGSVFYGTDLKQLSVSTATALSKEATCRNSDGMFLIPVKDKVIFGADPAHFKTMSWKIPNCGRLKALSSVDKAMACLW